MGFIVTIDGLKRALGRVVSGMSEALEALGTALAGKQNTLASTQVPHTFFAAYQAWPLEGMGIGYDPMDLQTGNTSNSYPQLPQFLLPVVTEYKNGLMAPTQKAALETAALTAAANAGAIVDIKDMIPSNASILNILATQAFVNSSIANMAANHVASGTDGQAFATKAALDTAVSNGAFFYQGEPYTPKKNDYCTVLADESNGGAAARWKYNGATWELDFIINGSGHTQAQLDALNSGVTALMLAQMQGGIDGKQAAITAPISGLFAGWTPAQILQWLSEFFAGQHKDVSIDVNGINVA